MEIGTHLIHKHNPNLTAKIIQRTNKGFRLSITDNSFKKPKTKMGFFHSIDFDINKGYWIEKQNSPNKE